MSREIFRCALRALHSRARILSQTRPILTVSIVGGAAVAAAYSVKRQSNLNYSFIPVVLAHSNKESHSGSKHDQEDEIDSNDEDPKISVMYDFFLEFASLEYKGTPYMTPSDFIESLIDDCPRTKRKRHDLSDSELKTIQKKAPSKRAASRRFFRNMGMTGIISYSEYLFLMHVLTKTERSLRIAFQVLDADSSGYIDKKEMLFLQFLIDAEKRLAREKALQAKEEERKAASEQKPEDSEWFLIKLAERAQSYASQSVNSYLGSGGDPTKTAESDSSPSKSDSEDESETKKEQKASDVPTGRLGRSYQIPVQTIDTTLLIHFFGKDGRGHLDLNDFSKFIENLQYEALEAEFQRYVGNHPADCEFDAAESKGGVIHVRDFARILFRHTEYARYCNVALFEPRKLKPATEAKGDAEDEEDSESEVRDALERAMKQESGAHRLRTDFVSKMASRLDSLKPADKHITFEQFCRFYEMFKHLDDLKVAVKLYGMQSVKITRALFQRAFLAVIGHELDPVVVEVLFKMFDVNQDGSLSHDEFLSVMRERVQRHVHLPDHDHDEEEHKQATHDHLGEADPLTWQKFKSCLKTEIRKMK